MPRYFGDFSKFLDQIVAFMDIRINHSTFVLLRISSVRAMRLGFYNIDKDDKRIKSLKAMKGSTKLVPGLWSSVIGTKSIRFPQSEHKDVTQNCGHLLCLNLSTVFSNMSQRWGWIFFFLM